jgi:hypothetical protein
MPPRGHIGVAVLTRIKAKDSRYASVGDAMCFGLRRSGRDQGQWKTTTFMLTATRSPVLLLKIILAAIIALGLGLKLLAPAA